MMRTPALFLALLVSAGFAQQPERKLELKAGIPQPPPPPKPQPDDKFQVEALTGDLLLEYREWDGSVVQKRIERATKCKPEVSVKFEEVAPALIRYTYYLNNGQDAKQGISLFAVAVSHPNQLLNVQAPAGWRSTGFSLAEWGGPARYNWYSDNPGGLEPGGSAAPFVFDGPFLPGLTHLYIKGSAPVPSFPAELPSDWLREQLYQAMRFENNSLKPLVAGPKIPLAGMTRADVVRAVANELRSGAGFREFSSVGAEMTALGNRLLSDQQEAAGPVRAAISSLAGNATNPLQRSLLSALVLDLDFAARMP